MVQENSLTEFAVVICGPTGSGKSNLAIELASLIGGEIISADSIAIYKGLDIGAAKPNVEDRKLVAHHMIDIAEPIAEYSVAQYKEDSRKIMADILSRGKVPIICGGTGYYIDALLYDFSYGNCQKDENFRKKCDEIIEEKGIEFLYERLKSVDPETYITLHVNDKMRIVRALEIFETTGVKKSEITDKKTPVIPFFAYSYDYRRDELYSRINERVDKMFDQGLVAEVENLLTYVSPSAQSMQGIGYKEIVDGLKNNSSVSDMKESVKLNTRHYAKRQITWFKRLENITYLKPECGAITVKDDIYGKLRNTDVD